MSEDFWFDSCLRKEVYLFSKMSTPALGPTQLHFQWVLGIVSLGEKHSRFEAEHLSLLSRLKMNRAIPPFPRMPSWRGLGLHPVLYFMLVVHGDSWWRHCTTSWKIASSIPDGSLGFFFDLILLAAPEPSSPLSL
jgi:hypothetical protein